ncbi:hypothetical protein ACJZ2D_000687 [Fusarium nematophilum]
MYRDEDIYGEDACCFRPERWLSPDPGKQHVKMIHMNEMLFNHGKAQCLGKTIVQMETGKALFELLHNFGFTLINPTRPWKVFNMMGIFAISDMCVEVKNRLHAN